MAQAPGRRGCSEGRSTPRFLVFFACQFSTPTEPLVGGEALFFCLSAQLSSALSTPTAPLVGGDDLLFFGLSSSAHHPHNQTSGRRRLFFFACQLRSAPHSTARWWKARTFFFLACQLSSAPARLYLNHYEG